MNRQSSIARRRKITALGPTAALPLNKGKATPGLWSSFLGAPTPAALRDHRDWFREWVPRLPVEKK